MTLTNQQRASRCADALISYSDDDLYTNLVDLLADAMHWCQIHDHSFADALNSAQIHFDAELVEVFDDPPQGD